VPQERQQTIKVKTLMDQSGTENNQVPLSWDRERAGIVVRREAITEATGNSDG
jgi:hypothetical protein